MNRIEHPWSIEDECFASGARTVVEAVANGKRVAEAMHEYMQSLPMPVTTDYPDVPVAETIDAAAQAEQILK